MCIAAAFTLNVRARQFPIIFEKSSVKLFFARQQVYRVAAHVAMYTFVVLPLYRLRL